MPALCAVLAGTQATAAWLYAQAAETTLQPVPLTAAERRICQPSDANISVLAGIVHERISTMFLGGGRLGSADEDGSCLPVDGSVRWQESMAQLRSLLRLVSMNLHAALCPPDDRNGRQASREDVSEIQVSTGSGSRENMLDISSSTYWQSNGSRPHWAIFTLKTGLIILSVEMESGGRDTSYCPSRVKLEFKQDGKSSWIALPETESISCSPVGTHSLVNLGNQAKRHNFSQLRLTILANHNSGQDSQIKSVRIKVAHVSEVKEAALQTATAQRVLASAREAAVQVWMLRHNSAAGDLLGGEGR